MGSWYKDHLPHLTKYPLDNWCKPYYRMDSIGPPDTRQLKWVHKKREKQSVYRREMQLLALQKGPWVSWWVWRAFGWQWVPPRVPPISVPWKVWLWAVVMVHGMDGWRVDEKGFWKVAKSVHEMGDGKVALSVPWSVVAWAVSRAEQ